MAQALAGMATIATGAVLGLGEVPGAEVVVAAGEALLSTAPSSGKEAASCPVAQATSFQQQLAQQNQLNQQQLQQAMAQLQQRNLQQMQQAMAQLNSPGAVHTTSLYQQQLAQLQMQNQQQLAQAMAQLQQAQRVTTQTTRLPQATASARRVVSQQPTKQPSTAQANAGLPLMIKAYTSARPVASQTSTAQSNPLPQAYPAARVVTQPKRLPQAYATPRRQQVAPKQQRPFHKMVQCLNQHPLQPTAHPGHVCDVCNTTISDGNGNMACCTRCDWDICASCSMHQTPRR